jgi:ABC-type bacteriocin/lantibiotic exporter with double-glycine peptidase domain
MVVVMAPLETAGVASVMPFLSVLGNPETVTTDPLLSRADEVLGFASVDPFLLALGAGALALIGFSAALRSGTLYAMNRWAMMRMHSLSERLLETDLRQPYAFFLNRHSGDMSQSLPTEAQLLQAQIIKPGLDTVAYGVVLAAIVTLLVIIDPVLAAGVAAVLGGMYALTYWTIRDFLDRIGRNRVHNNQERFQAAGEALGRIKAIKRLSREHA